MSPYYQTAELYDALNGWKDYPAEAEKLRAFIQRFKRSPGNRLLDVACGTGKHLELLRSDFEVEGLDCEPRMLNVARQRCPGVPFHEGDMTDFELGCQFDVVTCLFSAVGYCLTLDLLGCAVRSMAQHVVRHGVLIIEPFIEPIAWRDNYPVARFVDEPDLKVVRMNVSRREGRIAILDFHYLLATPAGVEHFTGRHDLGLFTRQEMEQAFKSAGVEVEYDADGLMGRGLYIGCKP